LITIKLLGGAKKAAGRSCITFNKPLASISEILTFLRENAVESKILNPNNILIAINGADSALLSGNDTLVKTGDIVTIVTVVHGGLITDATNFDFLQSCVKECVIQLLL
jgi:molybdopterin synthase sulfur carrier subunit